jgi:hypothetical protein
MLNMSIYKLDPIQSIYEWPKIYNSSKYITNKKWSLVSTTCPNPKKKEGIKACTLEKSSKKWSM